MSQSAKGVCKDLNACITDAALHDEKMNQATTIAKQQQRIAELEAWKKEATIVSVSILTSRDEAMDKNDEVRYLGMSTGAIIADAFKRAHEAEARIAELEAALRAVVPSHRNPANHC